jgi:hypothetical protein
MQGVLRPYQLALALTAGVCRTSAPPAALPNYKYQSQRQRRARKNLFVERRLGLGGSLRAPGAGARGTRKEGQVRKRGHPVHREVCGSTLSRDTGAQELASGDGSRRNIEED